MPRIKKLVEINAFDANKLPCLKSFRTEDLIDYVNNSDNFPSDYPFLDCVGGWTSCLWRNEKGMPNKLEEFLVRSENEVTVTMENFWKNLLKGNDPFLNVLKIVKHRVRNNRKHYVAEMFEMLDALEVENDVELRKAGTEKIKQLFNNAVPYYAMK